MLIFLLGSLANAASEVGHSRDFGIGLSFGSTVEGISLKLHDRTVAYQIVIGGYGGFNNFGDVWGARLDWLAETPEFVETDVLDLAVNVGIGGFGGFGDPFEGGAEGVLGIEALISPVPVDVVFEWTPELFLTNRAGDDNDWFGEHFRPSRFAAHVRVWF
jgi:hypothetical protein